MESLDPNRWVDALGRLLGLLPLEAKLVGAALLGVFVVRYGLVPLLDSARGRGKGGP